MKQFDISLKLTLVFSIENRYWKKFCKDLIVNWCSRTRTFLENYTTLVNVSNWITKTSFAVDENAVLTAADKVTDNVDTFVFTVSVVHATLVDICKLFLHSLSLLTPTREAGVLRSLASVCETVICVFLSVMGKS